MITEKSMENKKQDRAAFKKFFIVLIISAIVGGIMGFCSARFDGDAAGIADVLMGALKLCAPYGNLILGSLLGIVTLVLMMRAGKQYRSMDGEDEELLGEIDLNLSYALIVNNLNQIISFFFMGTGFYFSVEEMNQDIYDVFRLALLIVGFIYVTVLVTVFQKKIVNMEKEINTEKQGSIYDFKFTKVWMDSCDEAEKLQIYRSAYKAFRVTGVSYILMWIFCYFGMVLWDFGIMPMVVVLVLWGISVTSYSLEAIRLAKNPSALTR